MDQAYPDKLDDKITEELWAMKSNSPVTLQLSYAHVCKPRFKQTHACGTGTGCVA